MQSHIEKRFKEAYVRGEPMACDNKTSCCLPLTANTQSGCPSFSITKNPLIVGQGVPPLIGQVGNLGSRRMNFSYPWYLDGKGGDVVVTDRDNHRIQVISPAAEHTAFLPYGQFGHRFGQLNYPAGVAVTKIPERNVIVCDSGNKRVVFLKPSEDDYGHASLKQTHAFGGSLDFEQPLGVAADVSRKRIYIADYARHTISIHDFWGKKISECRSRTRVNCPTDVIVDEESGLIYATNSLDNLIHCFEGNGDEIRSFGKSGSGDGEFCKPWGLFLDREKRLLISDLNNNRIQSFTTDGKFDRIVCSDLYLPRGLCVTVHQTLAVVTSDPCNFIKIFKYK